MSMYHLILSFIRKNPVLSFGSGIVLFSLILVIFGIYGLFVPFLILPLEAIFFGSSIIALIAFWKHLLPTERWLLLFIFGIIILLIFFSRVESVAMTGRDQGSIAMAAIELAQHHRLAFSLPVATDFFHIYGPGEALNFPGFFYTATGELITKFPLGYTVFLAAFFQTFGLHGIIIAQSLLLFASGLILLSILRNFAPKTTWGGMFLFATSLIPIFLFHLTLTENFALFLFLFLALQLMLFFRDHAAPAYFATVLAAGFFPFVRVEGFTFLTITLLVLILPKPSRDFLRQNLLKRCLLPGAFFLIMLSIDFFANNPFYHVIGKELLKSVTENAVRATSSGITMLPAILSLYGILPLFCAGIISILILIRYRRWSSLIPTVLALPTFLYLLSPSITPDHPWMLRRFLFSVWPACLISFLFGMEYLIAHRQFQKKAMTLLIVLLFSAQVPALVSFTSTHTPTPILPQISSVSITLSASDRLLIDRDVTGDGFSMMSGPLMSLFGKNAAYFFNPLDMQKLSFPESMTTLLLIPEEKADWYEQQLPDFILTKRNTIDFTLTGRETLPTSIIRFPISDTQTTHNILFTVIPRK